MLLDKKIRILRSYPPFNTRIMIQSFLLSFSQIKDAKIIRPMIYATLLTTFSILAFLILGANTIDWVLDSFSETLTNWFGDTEGILQMVLLFIGTGFILVLGYFAFAGIHAAFLGIFIDDIFEAVKARHYPDLELLPAPSIPVGILFSIRFICFSLLINMVAFPFYLIGWFIPPIGIAMQVCINGYLLGKEYGQLLAFRIRPDKENKNESYFQNGAFATCLWMIPVLNLFAPVLLAASVMHTRMKTYPK